MLLDSEDASLYNRTNNDSSNINFHRHRHSFSPGYSYGQSQTYNPYTMTGVNTVRRSLRTSSNDYSPRRGVGGNNRMFMTSQQDFTHDDSSQVNYLYQTPDDLMAASNLATLRRRDRSIGRQGSRSRHQSTDSSGDLHPNCFFRKRDPSLSSSSRSRSNSRHHVEDKRSDTTLSLSIYQPPEEFASPPHPSHQHHVSRRQYSSRNPSSSSLLSSSSVGRAGQREQSDKSIVSEPFAGNAQPGHHSHRSKSITRRMTTSSILSASSILDGSSFHAFHDLDGLLLDASNASTSNSFSPSNRQPFYASATSSNSVGSMMMLLPDPPEEQNKSYGNNILNSNLYEATNHSYPYLLSDSEREQQEGQVVYTQVAPARSKNQYQRDRHRSQHQQLASLYSTIQRPSRKHVPHQPSMTRNQNMMDPRSIYGYVGDKMSNGDDYYYQPKYNKGTASKTSTVAASSGFITKSCQNIPNASLSIPSTSAYYDPVTKNTSKGAVPQSSLASTANYADNYYNASTSQSNLLSSSPPEAVVSAPTSSSNTTKVASPSSASTDSSSVSSSNSSGLKSNATLMTPMFSSNSASSSSTPSTGNQKQHSNGNSATPSSKQTETQSASNYRNNSSNSHHPILALASNPSLVSEGGNSDEHLLLHQRPLDINEDSLEGLDDEDVEAHIQSMNGFSSSSQRDHSHHRSHHQKGSSHSSHHSKRGRHSSKRGREGEVGCCMKYTLFGVNTIAWIIGFIIMMIGIWAWNEKDYLSNLTNIPLITLDPAFALIVIGLISFVIGFTGCIGALRENTCLLATYSVFLISILVLELSLSVLAFILKDWVSF